MELPGSSGRSFGWRTFSFRLAAAVGIPLSLLLGIEGVLRLGGFGYPTSFLLTREIEGRKRWVDNQQFGRRFFPPGLVRYPRPMSLPMQKPPGTRRVFVFGESAAMGDPEPRFGLPRMLETLLRERFPEQPVEVVNTAMVAINSHVILPIARECAELEGDLWVIYMGNNEMIGPFGSLTQFGARAPSLAAIRAGLALKSTKVGQALDSAAQSRAAPVDWTGMTLWQDQSLHPSDPSVARVYRHFEENLRAILNLARRARVPVILCTIATSLKDCAPFASVHASPLTAAQSREWDAAVQEGQRCEGQGQWALARDRYQQALAVDPHYAGLLFRLARCHLALGDGARAQQLFRDARDTDALPFRADSRINEIIRRCAQSDEENVCLLDFEQAVAAAAPLKIAGREHFYEHVHLNPAGNYLLARAVAEEAFPRLGLASPSGSSGWPGQSECLAALGFTEWNRHGILEKVLERIEQPPFTHQLNHDEQVALLREEIQQGRAATKPILMRRAAKELSALVGRRPTDPDLRWNLAELLDTLDDVRGAEEQWRAVIQLLPQAHLPYYNLGRLLSSHGRKAEALRLYQQSLQAKPDDYLARSALGALLTEDGRARDALPHLQSAVRQRPAAPEARLALGLAFKQAGDRTRAAQQFKEVLRLQPEHAQARQLLTQESAE